MDSKGLLIPVLTAILGSSIISTISTNSYNDFINSIKQPDFKVYSDYNFPDSITNDANEISQQQSIDNPFLQQQPNNKTPQKEVRILTIEITNIGNEIAKNPTVTFDFSDSVIEIIDFNAPRNLENNITSEDDQLIYYLDISKINIGETIPVDVTVNIDYTKNLYSPFDSLRYYQLGFGEEYIEKITINHEEGVKTYPNENSKVNSILNFIIKTIIPILIIFGIIFGFYFYHKYKQKEIFSNSKNNIYFSSKLKNLLSKIDNDIHNNINSLKIYDFNFWMKTNNEIRKNFFDNYEDFNIVNQLFIFLRHREYECLKEKIDNTKLINYNKECLSLAQKALNRIDWNKHIFYNVIEYPKILLIFRFSIYSLVIIGLEYVIGMVMGGIVRDTIGSGASFYAFIIITFITRVILYYLIFKRIFNLIMITSLYEDHKTTIFNNIIKKRRKSIFSSAILIIGLPSFMFISMIANFIGIRLFDPNMPDDLNNIYYIFTITLPWMILLDILRINILSILLWKKKISI